jgi:Holliday junction resolvase RusA-like endonuclease
MCPSSNRLWRTCRGVITKSQVARDYQRTVKLTALAAGVRPLKGDVVLTIAVYRERKVGDLSNRIKIVEDALIGVAYLDDKQVVELHATRHDDPADPRLVVTVGPLITCEQNTPVARGSDTCVQANP